MSAVDLLHFPLAQPSVGQQGDGPVRAAAGQDEAMVVRSPAHGVHCRKEGGTYCLTEFLKKTQKNHRDHRGESCNFVS